MIKAVPEVVESTTRNFGEVVDTAARSVEVVIQETADGSRLVVKAIFLSLIHI